MILHSLRFIKENDSSAADLEPPYEFPRQILIYMLCVMDICVADKMNVLNGRNVYISCFVLLCMHPKLHISALQGAE